MAQNNRKLYLLGIDGLSFDYIKQHLDDLPNFSSLFESGNCKVLKSTFPPDSIPSWVTIYTGDNPSEHGVLDSIDYLDEKKVMRMPSTDAFKGKTFWDAISNQGKKVCVINPFLAFPVWDVNGFFVNGSAFASNKQIDANNKELLREIPPVLGGATSFPKKKELDQFIKSSTRETDGLCVYASKLHELENYDLFFVSYFAMDRYQHFLWRYSDSKDITHPKDNKFKNVILDFYKHFDGIVGEVRQQLKEKEALIVISDHGHGRRCEYVLNINEVLRKHGFYLVSAKKFYWAQSGYFIERFKNFAMEIIFRYDLEDIFYKLAKFIPNRKDIKRGKHLKTCNNIAEACTLFGTNPFGGIRVFKENIPQGETYEKVRDKLIELFSWYEFNGKRLFRWIKRREDVYSGKDINKFADLLFELDSAYGVNWAVFCKEIGYNTTHKKISGGHDPSGCFFAEAFPRELFETVHCVQDIYQVVVKYFDQ